MNQADKIKSMLMDDIHEMASHPELFAKHPDKDFTRDRKLSAEDVLLFPVIMERDSVPRELLKYFDFSTGTPTPSAYYQQRSKLVPDTYRQLLFTFNSHFLPLLYKDKYILTGVDGSGFRIFHNPANAESYNPPTGRSTRGFNEIHVVAAYLLTDRTYTDAVIQPSKKKNEYSAFCSLIDGCRTDQGIPLFIADRGFPSYNMFAHAKEKGVSFLVRAKDLYVERLLGSSLSDLDNEFDITVDRIVTRSTTVKDRTCPENPQQYRFVDKKTAFDYMAPGSSDEYHLRIRVVRAEVADGIYVNMVTNLPPEECTMADLKILYYLRWGIETSFLELKHAVGAVDFHCKAVEYVTHEVWARLLLYNFCSRITLLAVVEQKDTKHIYQVNYAMAIKNSHDFLR